MSAALVALGAEVLSLPTISIAGPPDPGQLEAAVREAAGYDWIVFTSANGVRAFFAALRSSDPGSALAKGPSLCAIGTSTAAALRREGAEPDLIPDEFVAEAIVRGLAERGPLLGKRFLLPRAATAREILPRLLREAGATVTDVPVYRTVPDRSAAERLSRELRSGGIDVVTFTSGSTVASFVDIVGSEIGSTLVASIGPITSATARSLGLGIDIEAAVHTGEGLVEAIRKHFSRAG
jgi:uroporphyrinogen III methyltransferase/synthase